MLNTEIGIRSDSAWSRNQLKHAIRLMCKLNSNDDIMTYPTYIFRYNVQGGKGCNVEKVLSCGDNGVFPNDRPCVLLLKGTTIKIS